MLEYEEKFSQKNFKFGFLRVKNGQTSDNEIYSNGKDWSFATNKQANKTHNVVSEMSEEFCEFLDFLGTKIELKGWTRFAGGLNTKSSSSSTLSWKQTQI